MVSRMCDNVNALPDDCLLPIFDLVPLSELFQLDLVCPRWASLFPSACARRHTLVFILGGLQMNEMNLAIPLNNTFEVSFDGRGRPFYDLPLAEREASVTLPFLLSHNEYCPTKSFDEFMDDDDEDQSNGFFDILYQTSVEDGSVVEELTELARLRRSRLSGQMVTYFTDLFPNVQTLVVIHSECYDKELHSLVGLLESPSWSLVTAKLWLRTVDIDAKYADRLDHHPIHSLLKSINQQSSSLRQLTLDIDGDQFNHFIFPIESFIFIAQLKEAKLFLGRYDRDNMIWNIMHRFDSTKLLNIGLGNGHYSPTGDAINPEFEFTTKVGQLYFDWSFMTVGQLDEFCLCFASLTTLRIRWSAQITFNQLVTNLASLTQLTHLKLHITFNDHPENAFAFVNRVGNDDEEEAPIMSLPQIKLLELVISNRSHHDFESLSPLVFPSVEVIVLDITFFMFQCATCRLYDQFVTIESVINRCDRLLILSLKDKFANSRLYARAGYLRSDDFVDWTNYVRTEDDALPEIGDDGDD